ncbi:hypothetical protein [Planococcus halocryophilus]|nr:hypothetical protein [Planococcus halocryophilus]
MNYKNKLIGILLFLAITLSACSGNNGGMNSNMMSEEDYDQGMGG